MTVRLPRPTWAAERLFERAGVYPHAPSDSYRGDLAALYHLVDEGLGDLEALCDFGHAEELDANLAAFCPRTFSIPNRRRLANLVYQLFIIVGFVKSCVPCLSQ